MPRHPADPRPVLPPKRTDRRRPCRGGRDAARRPVGPLRSSVRLADLEATLAARLLALMKREAGVTGVNEYPEAFEWVDGRDGRDHLHLPLALVSRVNGDLAFVDAMPRILLRRDPELGGTRRRIELECMARGASYEIWTEDEILEDRSAVQVLRVAGTAERASHASALRSLQAPMAGDVPILTAMAGRLLVDDLRAVGAGWVGRSRLTGIPMALLCDMEVDPETRMFVWRPRSPAGAGQRAAGNHPGGEASASARDDAP